MLVEDDNNLREIYGERLMAEGYDIVSANDGEEALALAIKEKPDLILSDVMMPKISGFDMLDILRQTPETKNTKVVMMTALSQTEDKDRAEKLGADKYLVKSQVTLEDVTRVVHDMLHEDAAPAAAAANATPEEQAKTAAEPTVTTEANSPAISIAGQPQQPDTPAETANPVLEPTNKQPDDSSSAPATEPSAVQDQQPVVPITVTDSIVTDDNNASGVTASDAAKDDSQQDIRQNDKPSEDIIDEQKTNDSVKEPSVIPESQPINPITGEAAAQELNTSTGPAEPTAAVSTEEESKAFNKEVSDFADKDTEPATPEGIAAPIVEPTINQDVSDSESSGEESHPNEPDSPKPAEEPVKDAQETTSGLPDSTSDTSSESPAHKKVVQPISKDASGSSDINTLYEEEMRREADSTSSANPDSNQASGENPETTADDTGGQPKPDGGGGTDPKYPNMDGPGHISL
jgi:CheY-like chemotaxis protein